MLHGILLTLCYLRNNLYNTFNMSTTLLPFEPLNPEQLNVEAFLDAHDDVLRLSEADVRTAWDVAELESPELPYHNFRHEVETAWEAMKLVRFCDAHGVRLNANDLFYAALFHDARFDEDHHAAGFPTKELYSQHVLDEQHKNLHLSEARLKRVGNLIVATTLGEKL